MWINIYSRALESKKFSQMEIFFEKYTKIKQIMRLHSKYEVNSKGFSKKIAIISRDYKNLFNPITHEFT